MARDSGGDSHAAERKRADQASGAVHVTLRRRTFMAMLAGGMLAAPLAAKAPGAEKTHRIGWIAIGADVGLTFTDAFNNGRRELGLAVGQNVSALGALTAPRAAHAQQAEKKQAESLTRGAHER